MLSISRKVSIAGFGVDALGVSVVIVDDLSGRGAALAERLSISPVYVTRARASARISSASVSDESVGGSTNALAVGAGGVVIIGGGAVLNAFVLLSAGGRDGNA